LQSLHLDNNKIGSEGVTAIALQWLCLGNNNIGSDGAAAVTKKAVQKQTRNCNVCILGNNMGREGAAATTKALETNWPLEYLVLPHRLTVLTSVVCWHKHAKQR